jgi:pyruvoyl-dependent arginine decarboxylase (PvlArgDC)
MIVRYEREKMFVIHRTDKEYGCFSVSHETAEQATEEATRLATKHAQESPEFTIYELKEVKKITAKVAIFEP